MIAPRGLRRAVLALAIVAAGQNVSDARRRKPKARPKPTLYPTLATAGAKECRLGAIATLGPVTGEPPAVGFGVTGAGLAAWKQNDATIKLQRLTADGALRGKATTLASPVAGNELSVEEVYGLDAGFLVLLRYWDWQKQDIRWWGLAVDAAGAALAPPAALDLAGFDVIAGQPTDKHGVALLTWPSYIATAAQKNGPARWLTLTVGADGTIASSALDVDLAGLVTTTNDRWEAAVRGGVRGWVASQSGKASEGVFDGVRGPADGAVLLAGADAIAAEVFNGAEPPPRGPNGTIYEAAAQPILVRTRAGKPVGSRTALEDPHGDPAGEGGLHVTTRLAWTGVKFVYPFTRDGVAALLPIDCTP